MSLITIGFVCYKSLKKGKYKLTVKENHFQNQKMIKQNISFTYLLGAPGLSFIFLHPSLWQFKSQHEPVPGLAPFDCSSLAVPGHMTAKPQSSTLV